MSFIRSLRAPLLFVVALVAGSVLGAILTVLWDAPNSFRQTTPVLFAGYVMTYASFGAVPAILFGVPAVVSLKRMRYARQSATAVLTLGGGVVGGLLMFATFGMFHDFGLLQQLGVIAGASIGFAVGMLLFPGRVALSV